MKTLTLNVCLPVTVTLRAEIKNDEVTVIEILSVEPPSVTQFNESLDDDDWASLDEAYAEAVENA